MGTTATTDWKRQSTAAKTMVDVRIQSGEMYPSTTKKPVRRRPTK